jgi:hypothetical protein
MVEEVFGEVSVDCSIVFDLPSCFVLAAGRQQDMGRCGWGPEAVGLHGIRLAFPKVAVEL